MGIRGKLVASTLALAFLIGAAPATYSVAAHRAGAHEEFERRGLLIAEQLAEQLASLVEPLQSINYAPSVMQTRDKKDIDRAFVLDAEGTLLTDGTARTTHTGRRLPHFEAVRASVAETRTSSVIRHEGLMHITTPVMTDDTLHGFVHLHMSLSRANEAIQQSVLMQASLFGGLLVVGIGLAFLMSHAVTGPVRWMLKGTSAIKDGNYNVRIPVRTRDELGRLASSINDVAESLKKTIVSRNYVNEILQSMADTLIVVDTDAVIVTVNRATAELLGYTEGQLVGQPASLICVDEGYQLTGARLQHLLGKETQQDHELIYRTSDGQEIAISFSGSPIRDHSDTVVGYVCIGKDITDRKHAEAERDTLNQQLVATSRQAGMAEVATGVLHNVGNVLNSVNMSASLVVGAVKKSKIANLRKAVDLLDAQGEALPQFIADDEKGRQIPKYLTKVTEALGTEQTTILQELQSLTKNINHIKDVIATQQSYSKVTGVRESVELSELLDEALQLNLTSLERHRIQVERSVSYVPPTRTDKHQVLQIIVNFITNARDAMDANDGEKVLTLSLSLDTDDTDRVRLSVADNGAGIATENMTRIFTHGFTTKEKGHGFGLHSAALTAKELGGNMEVESDGPGHGSIFTLVLPLDVAGVSR